MNLKRLQTGSHAGSFPPLKQGLTAKPNPWAYSLPLEHRTSAPAQSLPRCVSSLGREMVAAALGITDALEHDQAQKLDNQWTKKCLPKSASSLACKV